MRHVAVPQGRRGRSCFDSRAAPCQRSPRHRAPARFATCCAVFSPPTSRTPSTSADSKRPAKRSPARPTRVQRETEASCDSRRHRCFSPPRRNGRSVRAGNDRARPTAPKPVSTPAAISAGRSSALRAALRRRRRCPRYAPVAGIREEAPLCAAVSEIASGSFLRREPPEIVGSGYVVKSPTHTTTPHPKPRVNHIIVPPYLHFLGHEIICHLYNSLTPLLYDLHLLHAVLISPLRRFCNHQIGFTRSSNAIHSTSAHFRHPFTVRMNPPSQSNRIAPAIRNAMKLKRNKACTASWPSSRYTMTPERNAACTIPHQLAIVTRTFIIALLSFRKADLLLGYREKYLSVRLP